MKQYHNLALAAAMLLSLSACSDSALRNSSPVIINRNNPVVQNTLTVPTAPINPANVAPVSPSDTRTLVPAAPAPTSSRQLNNYVEENIPIMPSRGRGLRPS